MNSLMRTVLFVLLIGSSSIVTSEPLDYRVLASVTETPGRLNGQFTQTKYLAVLQADITSSGRFSYQRDKQIIWLTEQPVTNELIITPTALVSRKGKDELLRLDMQTNPAAVILGDILFSVLTADWQGLNQYFDVNGELNGREWQAELLPSDQTIQQSISRVELQGNNLLRQIVLHEANGDATTIQFQNLLF